MKYLIEQMKKRKAMLAMVVLLLIGQVVGTLLVPLLIANIINLGVMNGDMNEIIHIGIQMLVVVVATTAVAVYGSYLSAYFASAVGRDLREAVFRKTQDLSVKDFDGFGTSSMITRTTTDVTNIQQTVITVLQLIVPAPLIIAASIIMTALISPAMTLIPIISIVVFIVAVLLVLKKSRPLSEKIQRFMDRINQVVRESIGGIRVIRAFDNGEYERGRSDEAFSNYAVNMITLNRTFAVLNPIVWLVMGLSMAAVVWLGGLFVAGNTIAIGDITAVIEYTIMTLGYLIMASVTAVALPKTLACLRRLSEVLDTEPEIGDAPVVSHAVPFGDKAKVEFKNVDFSYHGAELPVLHDVSFCCEAGQTTAIIGGTGAGKSTLAGLLLRLHDVSSGQICINGMDIRHMTQADLREKIGYVPQKVFLFSGTIADNLQMGNELAEGEALSHAACTAQAAEFIDSLPGGFQAPVAQGGSNFSGGQKQRISIARALMKKAPILVFDDSFSAVDYKTDAALRKALKAETKDSVVLIIAQRISTIKNADKIIVLDEGKIAGMGKHAELMKTCLIYQEIAKSQLAAEEAEAV